MNDKKYIPDELIDETGAILSPGEPDICQGNGLHPEYECCCDECAYFLKCFECYQDEVDKAMEMLRERTQGRTQK